MRQLVIWICEKLGLTLAISAGLVACGGDDNTQRLQITGSSTIAPLLVELAKTYEQGHPGIRIDVQTGGSARGIADSRQGLADIGMVSRDLKPEEQDLHSHALARDGIAIILHKDNSVSELTEKQIVSIYTGETQNWSELGPGEGMISVVSKAEGRSTLELFLSYFKLKSSDIKAHSIIGDNEQAIKTVLANPRAIAYVSIGTAEYSVKQGVSIQLLTNDAIEASTENVANRSFPLSRTLNLVTLQKPTGLAADFIAYAQSPAAYPLIERQYFVPL